MFSYGLHKTNLYETVAFCEWDKSCQQVLKKNFPEIYCYSDIKDLSYQDGYLYSEKDEVAGFTNIDVIVGGFPCQDISLAGKGAGLEGERSGLWKEYARLIGEIKPKGVIIENVSALLRRGLNVVLSDLHTLGYDAEWHCIPASYFGAPHQRDRIWIIAYRRCQGGEGHDALRLLHESFSEMGGQEKWCSQEPGISLWDNPFRESSDWPKPLLCGVDVQMPRRVDRIKQLGNTVYWPIVEQLGYHLHDNLCGK